MKRITQQINSDYIKAVNRLAPKNSKHRIVAYVESYEDIAFWSNLLRPLENDHFYFEVMLPSNTSLCKGKKVALSNDLGSRLGKYMIACVDADYDYLMQGVTPTSDAVCNNPFVFHTYVYAIENYQCYAPTLRSVCVNAMLNDHVLFDFESFLQQYSEVIWPLFVWNIWAYRYGVYKQFSMLDFYHVVRLGEINYFHPDQTLSRVRHLVNGKISRLQRQFQAAKSSYKPLRDELLQLGLTPATTYLYMRGHDLFDGVVVPLLSGVCDALGREREREIRRLAEHTTQLQNELSAYRNAVMPFDLALRRHSDYTNCPQYLAVQNDVRQFLNDREPQHQQAAD